MTIRPFALLGAGLLLALTGLLHPSPASALVEVGDRAPDFTLTATTGGKISLSQFRGKRVVLLEFYGADFSPVWAANLSARKADHAGFEALGVQILGISSNNPFSQKVFADSLGLTYPLLSDFPNLETIKRYGGLNQGWAMTTAQRAFFLVDREGIVRGKWLGTVSDLFPSAAILEAARALTEARAGRQ